jgi:tight adherence protein C
MPTIQGIPLTLIFLVATIVVAIGTAVYVALAESERKATLDRVSPVGEPERITERLLLSAAPSRSARFAAWVQDRMPAGFSGSTTGRDKLTHAGFDGTAAPILFSTFRIASLVLFPVLGLLLAPRDNPLLFYLAPFIGFLIGIAGPQAILDRLVASRQSRIRRSIPDALDLLVVCVEAGVSLDAAIVRVSRDMATLHPDLSLEFAQVVRRVNAGMARDRALQGLFQRTGVDELRTLAASMIQCERLGTSIARVLRINAESLRLKRRQHAEKRAAEAALKMIFPLALFLLPALMVIILGPAVIEIMRQLGGDTLGR